MPVQIDIAKIGGDLVFFDKKRKDSGVSDQPGDECIGINTPSAADVRQRYLLAFFFGLHNPLICPASPFTLERCRS
jgi:hypothetical protein